MQGTWERVWKYGGGGGNMEHTFYLTKFPEHVNKYLKCFKSFLKDYFQTDAFRQARYPAMVR